MLLCHAVRADPQVEHRRTHAALSREHHRRVCDDDELQALCGVALRFAGKEDELRIILPHCIYIYMTMWNVSNMECILDPT